MPANNKNQYLASCQEVAGMARSYVCVGSQGWSLERVPFKGNIRRVVANLNAGSLGPCCQSMQL